MVGGTGIEPVTSSASRKHSSTELTARVFWTPVWLEAALGFEPRIEDLQSSAFPLGYAASNYNNLIISLEQWSGKRDLNPRPSPWQGDALPLSYFRKKCIRCRDPELNWGHVDFQSTALPTELSRQKVFL